MVATFNGWEDVPELERELLERWEEEAMGYSLWAKSRSSDQRRSFNGSGGQGVFEQE